MKSPVDILADGVSEGVFPGGQLAASIDGKRLASTAIGAIGPGLGPTDEAVIYDLASLTKPLATAILFLRATERGRCALDDPLSKQIPGADPSILAFHALEHSSGLPAHERFDRRLPIDLAPGSWAAHRHIVEDAARITREAAPGERALYSDIGYILLGAALESVYARPLSAAHNDLGTSLFYRDRRGPPAPPSIAPRSPIAPTEGSPGEVHDENARAMGGAAGHAGLFGTAEGILAICEDLVRAYHGQSGGLLAPGSVRQMWQPSRVKGSTRTIGWDRPSAEGSSTGGRWPLRSVGHLGFTGTSVWIEPERALIVVLVTNRVCPTRDNDAIRRFRPLLYDAAWEAWA
jgi:CubicO group peptidase (beta-lactamase class C family)